MLLFLPGRFTVPLQLKIMMTQPKTPTPRYTDSHVRDREVDYYLVIFWFTSPTLLWRRKWEKWEKEPTPLFVPGESHGLYPARVLCPWNRKRWTRLSNQTTSTTLLRGIDFHGSLTAHRVARGEGCSSLNLSDIVWGQLEFLFSNKSNNKQQHCKQEESFLSHLENVCN